jgi:hypothetical protein
MNIAMVQIFVGGAIAMGFAVAGGFFLRFWRRAQEPLFLAFAMAFWLMAIDQVVVTLIIRTEVNRPEAYLFRLAAFALIVLAIIRKNLAKPS